MKKATEKAAPVQAFHYFASCGIGWGVGETVDEALAKVASIVGGDVIRRSLKDGGLYVWTCRVELPVSARYSISYFKPETNNDTGEPVPLSESQDWHVVTAKGTAIPVARESRIANRSR